MKHKVLSLALALMLCLSLLPTGALAADVDAALDVVAAVEETVAEEVPAEASAEEEAETLLSGGVEINETNFPDAIFREYVAENFDTDGDEYLSDEEIAAVECIECEYGTGITSFEGIKLFANLTAISIWDLAITSLDVSGLDKLVELTAVCGSLTSIDVTGCVALELLQLGGNRLERIDVSTCVALQDLSCYDNLLVELDVSKNEVLYRIDAAGNNLTGIDISCNPNLDILYLQGNKIESFENVIIPEPEIIRVLGLGGNPMELPDLSAFTNLTDLDCSYMNLSTLDLSSVPKLERLDCSGNNLGSLDLSVVPELKILSCAECGLEELDISAQSLTKLECAGNELTKLDISGSSGLNKIYATVEYQVYDGVVEHMVYRYDEGLSYDEGVEIIAAPYDSETPAAYVEYIAAFLTEQGAEESIVEELTWVAEAGEYEELEYIMNALYEAEVITELPMTYEEFAVWYNGGEVPEEPILGDTDGDGEVFVDDLVLLMKSIINVDGAEVSAEAGNLNVDGAVDILDVICLVRELAQMYPATG